MPKSTITAQRVTPREDDVVITMPLSTAHTLRRLCLLDVTIPKAIKDYTKRTRGCIITGDEAYELMQDLAAAIGTAVRGTS